MAINIRPFDTNLRSSSRFSVNTQQNSAQASSQIRRAPSTLNIQRDESKPLGESNAQETPSDRQRVISKTSSQLFSAASSLTSRNILNESLTQGVNQLRDLAYKIKDEVDPTKKEDLINEANTLVSSLQAQYDEAVEDDPNLATTVSITSLVKPGADFRDGSKVTQTLLEKITSPDDSGLASIDFSDIDEAISKIEQSLSNYTVKQKSLDVTASEIAGATKKALIALDAESQVSDISEEEKSKELANEISKSTENLLSQTKINENTVQELLKEDDEEESEDNKDKDDSSNSVNPRDNSAYAKSNEEENNSIEISA